MIPPATNAGKSPQRTENPENVPVYGKETQMAEMSAGAMMGQKLDSIPFSAFHGAVILVLGLVGFIDGYDLALTGSLLVLAKGPLHITPEQIRWLTIAATLFVVVGGFIASAISDHVSRKVITQIGVVGMTFFTLLIPLVQTAEQLIIVRLLTGIGLGFAITTPFPVAAELMPAQHRRTFGAIYGSVSRAHSHSCRSSALCWPANRTGSG
jgi:MFS-type transporter involved in bile tolerance (Atg22 family)